MAPIKVLGGEQFMLHGDAFIVAHAHSAGIVSNPIRGNYHLAEIAQERSYLLKIAPPRRCLRGRGNHRATWKRRAGHAQHGVCESVIIRRRAGIPSQSYREPDPLLNPRPRSRIESQRPEAKIR